MIDPIRTEPTGVEVDDGSAAFPRSLQWLAVVGVVIALLGASVRSFAVKDQGQGLLTFILVAVAVVLTARRLFAPAWKAIVARPYLLVPIGIVLLAQEVIGWLARIPFLSPIFALLFSGQLLGLSGGLSVVGT
jgi:DMSO/TMAO reductase YedYZ heme-binding membrane subunit